MKRSKIDRLTKKDYRRAFVALHPLAEHHIRLLKAHFNAPEHITTATQLAGAVGYARHIAVNLHYGKLGRKVSEAVGCDSRICLDVLVTFSQGAGAKAHCQLTLRPPVVEALRELNWW